MTAQEVNLFVQFSYYVAIPLHCLGWHYWLVNKLPQTVCATTLSISKMFFGQHEWLLVLHHFLCNVHVTQKYGSWTLVTVARMNEVVLHLTSSKFGIFELGVAEDEVLKSMITRNIIPVDLNALVAEERFIYISS